MSEELIIRHCSPTLAGIKTGSMFNCPYTSLTALKNDLRFLNRTLGRKGLRTLPLKLTNNRALIYIYRPEKLKCDLSTLEALSLLNRCGYSGLSAEASVGLLARRVRASDGFPHEIGLFLGYPPEDVKGFIENNAKNSKFTGCWRVYSNEETARKTFARYKKCTDAYTKQLHKGKTLDKLTVAV